MSFDALKDNIQREKEIVSKLKEVFDMPGVNERDLNKKKELAKSLMGQLVIINDSFPEILENIKMVKELPKLEFVEDKWEKKPQKETNLVSVSYGSDDGSGKTNITIKKRDKDRLLKEVNIESSSLKKIKKYTRVEDEKPVMQFKKPSKYISIANRLFLKQSINLSKSDFFISLRKEIKRSNMQIMLSSYLSVIFFTMLLSFFASVLIMIFFLFFNLSVLSPFILVVSENIFMRFLKVFWIIFAVPIITFLLMYYYPGTEAKSLGKRVENELPFVTIHMASIAGSGIVPSQIFRVIVMSGEYPHVSKELTRLINQINVYGYDLSTALRNSAAASSSEKFAELLNGMSATINSGGDLSDFLKKKAESLVFEYNLNRQKYNKVAETFMNVYISTVIAAPMILMLMMIMIKMTGFTDLSLDFLTVVIISSVVLINLVFLVFLHIKQEGMS